MALNNSGPISLGGSTTGQSINLELKKSATAQVSFNDADVRKLAGRETAGSSVSMPPDFWGKTFGLELTVSSDQVDLNVRNYAIAQGWNGTDRIILTINAGVWVYASSLTSYAMTITGSFPNGIEIINYGVIAGKGGTGGAGGNIDLTTPPVVYAGFPGTQGGTAIYATTPVSINNASGGIIAGGGGGGGGGAGMAVYVPSDGNKILFSAGPGGGGGSRAGAAGSRGISSGGVVASFFSQPTNGSASVGNTQIGGAYGSPGVGNTGTSGDAVYTTGVSTGSGGDGGTLGYAGQNGNQIPPDTVPTYSAGQVIYSNSGGAGGAAGYSVSGISNVTWIAQGDLRGPTQ